MRPGPDVVVTSRAPDDVAARVDLDSEPGLAHPARGELVRIVLGSARVRSVCARASAERIEDIESVEDPHRGATPSESLSHLHRLLDVPERAVQRPGDLVPAEHVQPELLRAEGAGSRLELDHRFTPETSPANRLVELDLVQPRTGRTQREEEPPDRIPAFVLDHEQVLVLRRSPIREDGLMIAFGFLLRLGLRHPGVVHEIAHVEPSARLEPVGKLVVSELSQGHGHRERGC